MTELTVCVVMDIGRLVVNVCHFEPSLSIVGYK